MTKHMQSTRTRHVPKRNIQEAREQGPPQAARGGGRTDVLPGMHNRAAWDARPCIPLSPIHVLPLQLFRFLRDFVSFGCCFVLKGACI